MQVNMMGAIPLGFSAAPTCPCAVDTPFTDGETEAK